MLDKYYDEQEVGERWQSRGRTITEADLVLFAAVSGDWYPLHTDKEWAAQTQFGQRIAHGLLVLSAASGLWHLRPGTVAAFYGIDRLRFVRPTFIGDTIRVETEVLAKEDKNANQGVVTFQHNVVNQRGETVLVSTIKFLVNRRTAAC